MNGAAQRTLYRNANRYLPSGVNSPVRAFRAVGGTPVFTQRGKGAYIWDENRRRYLDFCSSWGPLLFGHAPAGLIKRVSSELKKGTSFGTATAKEVQLAEKIHRFFPSIEKCRLVSSGTEAVMSAIRLARGFTGRKKILKIDGGYHGHADSLLIKAGSGSATFGVPDSAGIPKELAALTLSIPFNDINALERVFKKEGRNIAAFILEPVPANMGIVLPRPGYLAVARLLTKKYGSLLIFDEVISGFRVSEGGAQKVFGITPDLTCLGKVLGGGFPLAAFGGRGKIMDELAPEGTVYQAGTLSGNPVAVTAALWMLKQLETGNKIQKLNQKAESFFMKIQSFIESRNLPVQLNYFGSMFTLFFTEMFVEDFVTAKHSNARKYSKFFHFCLKNGIYLAPSQFEANFISTAHTDRDLRKAVKVFESCLNRIV